MDFSNGKADVADFTREVAIEDDINLIFNSTIHIKFKYQSCYSAIKILFLLK